MPKELSIVIVNWNGGRELQDCLKSVYKQISRDFEIIIVDNASTDGSVEEVELKYPNIKIIKNNNNQGYAKALNKGIRASYGQYVFPLNWDILIEPNFLKEVLKAIEQEPQIGSVTGKLLKLLDGKKTKIIDSTGHVIQRNRLSKNRGEWEIDNGQYNTLAEVFGVCGAASLYRREMLEDIKFEEEYLDEDFILGCDDADLDWRARLHGWKALYTPYAVGFHKRSSVAKSPRRLRFYNYRNRYLMIVKNDSLINILIDLPHIFIYELGVFFSMLIQFQMIPVLFSFLCLLPKFMLKRKDLQGRKKLGFSEMRRYFR